MKEIQWVKNYKVLILLFSILYEEDSIKGWTVFCVDWKHCHFEEIHSSFLGLKDCLLCFRLNLNWFLCTIGKLVVYTFCKWKLKSLDASSKIKMPIEVVLFRV
jgi:hypothetical protein